MDHPARILFVDDEPAVLVSLGRLLRGKFDLRVAASGREALGMLEREGPFAVVVSDLRMPLMDGVALLERLGQAAPDTVRIMLTGCADLEMALRAVNQGHVFQILSKPCPADVLERALYQGLRQYQRLLAERRGQAPPKAHLGLEGLALALAGLVEAKDPQARGHQGRVAHLAAALAQELGLTGERVEQVELAAAIHDLGKVLVPPEVLAKPGPLGPAELAMVRPHAQLGQDLLGGIAFPFSLAQIVGQHHERLDGSGYPRGIVGEDILLEARIIAVADVVEAMVSPRAHRPGLGLAAALQEIEGGQGRLYDPRVAEACLGLFRERGWRFEANFEATI
ncbi:MAG: response regulator [Desulfarculus sp.]|nr:response regulator [Desulfarculus sp.]